MYSIPFIGILFIMVSLSLSSTRKKRRDSTDITISMNPFSNDKYLPNCTTISIEYLYRTVASNLYRILNTELELYDLKRIIE